MTKGLGVINLLFPSEYMVLIINLSSATLATLWKKMYSHKSKMATKL